MPESVPIAVIDHGTGNLASLINAFRRIGVPVERLDHPPAKQGGYSGAVLPGVGAFPRAAGALRASGWWDWIREWAEDGRPLLGVCLGMQLLFDSSDELGGETGLALIPGKVSALEGRGERLPHIGWTEVTWLRPSMLSDRLPVTTPMYHVHSFACHPDREGDVLASAVHGSRFVAAAWNGSNVLGVQFHPEKSADDGLDLLAGFATGCGVGR